METTDSSVREIVTDAEFTAVRAGPSGCFVVTDRSTPTRIHTLNCYAVGLTHFRTKVIVNERRRGRYYAASSIETARRRFPRAVPCGLCHPFPATPVPPVV